MKKNMPIAITFIVIIIALFAISAVRKPLPPAPTTKDIWNKSGVPISTSFITRGDMANSLQITGDLKALNSAVISPKISGRLMSIKIREGDSVSAGQVVAVLDQEDAISNIQTAQAGLESARAKLSQAITNLDVTRIQTKTAIEQAKASLSSAKSKYELTKKPSRSQERTVAQNKVDSAKAQLDQAKADYDRYDRLLKRGSVSQADFDLKKANYLVALSNYNSANEGLSIIDEGGRREEVSSAQSQVDVASGSLRDAQANAAQNRVKEKEVTAAKAAVLQAKASLDIARRELENTYIKSPLSGVVSSRSADPGQVVAFGQELATIVDLKSIYFKGDISEQNMASVRKGQPVNVKIDALPDDTFNGSIVEIFPAGSTASRNFSVRISIPGASSKVKPGMFATGTVLTGKSSNVMLVSKDAVNDQEGTQSVFVIGKDKIAKRHVVTVVRTDSHFAQIDNSTDLKIGDIVATEGRKNLQDGTKVEIDNKGNSSNVVN